MSKNSCARPGVGLWRVGDVDDGVHSGERLVESLPTDQVDSSCARKQRHFVSARAQRIDGLPADEAGAPGDGKRIGSVLLDHDVGHDLSRDGRGCVCCSVMSLGCPPAASPTPRHNQAGEPRHGQLPGTAA